jgi:hypothetical protein
MSLIPVGFMAASSGRDTSGYITGGTYYTDGSYHYQVWTASGNIEFNERYFDVQGLVVAGGASGGSGRPVDNEGAGGGGAGGVNYFEWTINSLTNRTVVIGAGGASVTSSNGNYGSTSYVYYRSSPTVFQDAIGGGRGASNSGTGGNGGSGGGGGGEGGLLGGATELPLYNYTNYYGNDGGDGSPGAGGGGGGGGAGTAGSDGTASAGGDGGDGTNLFSDWLTAIGFGDTYIAGGGGGTSGSLSDPNGDGGLGGGGDGGNSATPAENGAVNSGSGGGADLDNDPSGAGGSGIAIVRWAV